MIKPFFEFDDGRFKPPKEEHTNCDKCGLFAGCKSPRMPYTGEGRLKCLIVAEAPGADEDTYNMQLIGEVGQFFREKLKERGLDLDRDFWKTNALICRPKNNEKPTRKQLKLCKENLDRTIAELKPQFIWLMGGSAIEIFYMDRFGDNVTPTRFRNLCIPDKKTGAWILPTFHPSYAMRNAWDDIAMSTYDRDIDFVLENLSKGRPVFPELNVKVLTEIDDVRQMFTNLYASKPKVVAFDYETTGLKPYRDGHKIISVSLCWHDKIAYAFPLEFRDHWTQEELQEIKQLWTDFLESGIFKVAHNLKFEDIWSRRILGVEVRNWYWCTMNGAHILDGRHDFTGLKFQACIRYGVHAYDKDIKKFLQANGDDFNNIEKADLKSLLTYGAYDSLLTFWLYEDQAKEIRKSKSLCKAMKFWVKGLKVLAKAQHNGIQTDVVYYDFESKKLEKKINNMLKLIFSDPTVIEFEKKFGKEFTITSVKVLREYFFEHMRFPAPKKTATELESVDESVLSTLESDVAKLILKIRKQLKIKDTYMAQFMREVDDEGKLHPFFDLHIPITYRSSSSHPNFQNIPVRDAEAKKATRSGIIPSPGRLILDWDYGSQEVRIAACYTQDPRLIDYINDPSTDMHRDQAAEVFQLPHDQVTKMLRFHAKNGFVFPEFYGSYYKNVAKALWKECMHLTTESGVVVKDHLYERGILKSRIDPYADFELHVKGIEEDFWNKFKVFKKWQERMWKDFRKKGYLEMFFGFKCSGYLTRNNIINYPIQGTAFHCLLKALIDIDEEWKFESDIIGQIHDNGLYDCYPEEKDEIIRLTEYMAVEKMRADCPWLVVPLTIEWEETAVDGSWYSKEKSEFDD